MIFEELLDILEIEEEEKIHVITEDDYCFTDNKESFMCRYTDYLSCQIDSFRFDRALDMYVVILRY